MKLHDPSNDQRRRRGRPRQATSSRSSMMLGSVIFKTLKSFHSSPDSATVPPSACYSTSATHDMHVDEPTASTLVLQEFVMDSSVKRKKILRGSCSGPFVSNQHWPKFMAEIGHEMDAHLSLNLVWVLKTHCQTLLQTITPYKANGVKSSWLYLWPQPPIETLCGHVWCQEQDQKWIFFHVLSQDVTWGDRLGKTTIQDLQKQRRGSKKSSSCWTFWAVWRRCHTESVAERLSSTFHDYKLSSLKILWCNCCHGFTSQTLTKTNDDVILLGLWIWYL